MMAKSRAFHCYCSCGNLMQCKHRAEDSHMMANHPACGRKPDRIRTVLTKESDTCAPNDRAHERLAPRDRRKPNR